MRVSRDFDEVYRREQDPWAIGDADSERYNLYVDLVKAAAGKRGSLLDIGCGQGALLARFRGIFNRLVGVETSAAAVERGKARFPTLEFHMGSADALDQALTGGDKYDGVLYSDVIYYLSEEGRRRSLEWISDHLAEGGWAFLAAWCPGGDYLDPAELRRLAARTFRIESEYFLSSGHALFILRKKRRLVSVTVDQETWQPIPSGKAIDWEKDVFAPTERLLELAGRSGVVLTFFAEMGEYEWLRANEPATALGWEDQWRKAVAAGHEVQLHLHPAWLPECGAKHHDDTWSWNGAYAKAQDYPGDLSERVLGLKRRLEEICGQAKPGYQVTCFRAGAYQAQPFNRLQEALVKAGFLADSSVYSKGGSAERGYDYAFADPSPRAWRPSSRDPQSPGLSPLVELPVFTDEPGHRWFLDGNEGPLLAERLLGWVKRGEDTFVPTEEFRSGEKWAARLRGILRVLGAPGRFPASLLPKRWWAGAFKPSATHGGDDLFVMIGHTKGEHDWDAVESNLKAISSDGRFEFVGLSQMAQAAQDALRPRPFPEAHARLLAPGNPPWEDPERDWAGRWGGAVPSLEKALDRMDWVYQRLEPADVPVSTDPLEVLRGGQALCMGYSVALGGLLRREGFAVRYATMKAQGHPRGRGPHHEDTHEVLLVTIEGRELILDPMANVLIPHSLEGVLRNPALAVGQPYPDKRHQVRGYELYDRTFWYERVTEYGVRTDPTVEITAWTRNPFRSGGRP